MSSDARDGVGPPNNGTRAECPVFQAAHVLAWSESETDRADLPNPRLALWLPAGVTVALGLSQKPEAELQVDAVRRDGVTVVRRQSGGGAVLLYPGVLCWEAMATLEHLFEAGGSGIRESYAYLSRPVLLGLREIGVSAFAAGVSDLSAEWPGGGGARKLAGTAQLRRRQAVLVHGSLLVCPDLSLLDRYLSFPSSQPDYRRNRNHRDFCATVRELSGEEGGEGLTALVAAAIGSAAAAEGWTVAPPPAALPPEVERLLHEKYLAGAWNWDKSRPPAGPRHFDVS